MNAFTLGIFNNFQNPKVIIALLIGVIALVILYSAKRFAVALLNKKMPGADIESEEYKNKLLNYTLIFKGIAAGIAVAACILSLI